MIIDKARVMLVDDHALVRHGMTSLINSEPNLAVVAEAGSSGQALEILAARIKIDILLLDLTLDKAPELDLIQQLHEQYPELPVLVVSMHNENVFASRVLAVGARGYVMKQAPGEELITAIHDVLQGKIYLSNIVKEHCLERMAPARGAANNQLVDSLTPGEFKIFNLIGTGFTSQQIATRLERSIKTIELHRANIRHKLGLQSGEDLNHFASELVRPQ